jgi:hypothetical protein
MSATLLFEAAFGQFRLPRFFLHFFGLDGHTCL